MSLAADESLTAPCVLPAAPANMAWPSSFTMNEAQQQLNETDWQLESSAKELTATRTWWQSCRVKSCVRSSNGRHQVRFKHHGSAAVLASITCPRRNMSHQHAHVMWSSSVPHGRLGHR